jgi:tyrosyl-tRNA synthetase
MPEPRFPPVDEQMRVIRRGIVDLLEEKDLIERLERSRRTGRPLRIKFGIDPSSPDIHLGHTVVLRKLRDFQRLGHQVVLLWGTATAMVGDPTGKNKTRPQLTREQVEANKQTYKDQVGHVLDIANIEERENSEWFDRMSFMDCVKLVAHSTVARMLERDSFEKRYRAGEPIAIQELIYPLMQGWDSVELQSDVELGGTEQLFNLHMGRDLQRACDQSAQVCITTPLLVGLDGREKMSKSLGNAIGVNESPTDMFGKCMRVPDESMADWFALLTDLSDERVDELLKGHPRAAKVELARSITADYHGDDAARAAVEEFDRVFRGGGLPDEVPEIALPPESLVDGGIMVAAALVHAGLCGSTSEARRLIQGGGVRLDGERVEDPKRSIAAGRYLLQAGKRKAARIVIG